MNSGVNFEDYVKECFKTAIMVDKVMPSVGPKSKLSLLSSFEACFDDLPKIIVTKEDVKVYEMVCFDWVHAFDKDELYLFGLLWKYHSRKPIKVLQKEYSCSRQTIFNWRKMGIKLIQDYTVRENAKKLNLF